MVSKIIALFCSSIIIFFVCGCGGRSTAMSTPVPSSSDPGSSSTPGTSSVPANATVFPNIERMPDWQWCTAQLNHQPCASGLGNATSSKIDNQASPALDGSSSKFTIAGPKGYSNALWWKSVSGGLDAAHFSYDVSFYIDHPEISEALEFDVNQSFNGARYVWGSECNFKDTGQMGHMGPEGVCMGSHKSSMSGIFSEYVAPHHVASGASEFAGPLHQPDR